MNTMFGEMGVFCIALVLMIYFQIYEDRKKYRDCLLFGRLLLSTAGILLVDTIGWLIDGKPVLGQIWFTTLIDGMDLILTSTVCWCWVQYALYIANGKKQMLRKWYRDFNTYLLFLQIILVASSQFVDFYYYVDAAGVYHRGEGYIIHSLISVIMLSYSTIICVRAYRREQQKEKKQEMLFVALIIVIPILGNVFQLFVYGYPTVWLCMVYMVFSVYIHIQNKRVNEERKEQNRILKKALLQAQSANTAKTEFLSKMSHDMRTPMNGILGMIRLSKDTTDVAELHENMVKAEAAGEYMLSLINDTLDLQKIESNRMELNPEVIFIRDYLDDVLSMNKMSAEQKQIHFKVTDDGFEQDQYVKIDKVRVKQIFTNLLSNAIKFTPEGGTVEIRAESYGRDGNLIHNRFEVKDTGVGMSSEFIEKRLFQPYSQENNILSSQLTGSGLGMAITKNLVELMGGHLEVESELGEGTTFRVYLDFEHVPRKIAEEEVQRTQKKKQQLPHTLQGRKILLCEDHPLNAEITKRLLEKTGCNVSWAENGKIGVELFQESNVNEFDLILMDIRMPEMDGLTAARTIRSMGRKDAKTIPIIAMTANAYDSDIKNSFAAGMNAHLAKPIEPAVFYETISENLSDNGEER